MVKREILITAILELADDEYKNPTDLIELAKASEEELISNLIHIAYYYKNETNN